MQNVKIIPIENQVLGIGFSKLLPPPITPRQNERSTLKIRFLDSQ